MGLATPRENPGSVPDGRQPDHSKGSGSDDQVKAFGKFGGEIRQLLANIITSVPVVETEECPDDSAKRRLHFVWFSVARLAPFDLLCSAFVPSDHAILSSRVVDDQWRRVVEGA